MKKRYTKKRSWSELEATEKLGYVWVLLYVTLIVATASAILIPAYYKWQEEHADEETGSLFSPPVNNSVSCLIKDSSHGFFGVDHRAGAAGGLSRNPRIG